LKSPNVSDICKKTKKKLDDGVEEVGEDNVIEIVIDNAANYNKLQGN